MDVAIASCAEMPEGYADHDLLCAELAQRGIEARVAAWDDESFDWSVPRLVAVRSTWDYTLRRDRFVEWASAIGERLHNSAALIAWNSDKRYLADLEAMDLPVVPTSFHAPGEEWQPGAEEVVVKPTVSAGGRDTGRFGAAALDQAAELVGAIHSAGKTAMIQPFLPSVDREGETALAFTDGRFSHALHKRAVLAPDEVAPIADFGPRAARAMYEPDLVRPGSAEADQLELAERVLAAVEDRFGYRPLYGRVDMLRGAGGEPILLELEMVEPNLYLADVPEAATGLAEAIAARL